MILILFRLIGCRHSPNEQSLSLFVCINLGKRNTRDDLFSVGDGGL